MVESGSRPLTANVGMAAINASNPRTSAAVRVRPAGAATDSHSQPWTIGTGAAISIPLVSTLHRHASISTPLARARSNSAA